MTDAELEDELKKLSGLLGHFPSSGDFEKYSRSDLRNKVSKTGGYFYWSERLGIPRKWSDSDTGWAGEAAVQEVLTGLGYTVVLSSFHRAPFDLLINGVVRVDVKTAAYATYGNSSGWFYRVGKDPTADLIILWQSDEEVMYPIPWYVCSNTNITITRHGKRYAKFRNNLDIISGMVAAREPELAGAIGCLQKKGPGKKPK